jgi:(2Fe-2S) ferredoxin
LQPSRIAPPSHVLVCGNRRAADDPLGSGCAERGDAVYDALKAAGGRRGLVARVWVTKTYCLGLCPRSGCTVGVYPARAFFTEVTPADVDAILARAATP